MEFAGRRSAAESRLRTPGVVGVVLIAWVVVWFWPANALLIAGGALLALSWLAGESDREVLTIAVAAAVTIALKDLVPAATARHWNWELELPGAIAPWRARQPDAAAWASGAATWGAVIALAGALRARLADSRPAQGLSAGLVLLGVGAVAWIGWQDTEPSRYGKDFALGPLLSRNAMGGALAMVSLLAIGAAWQARRRGAAVPMAAWVAGAAITAWGVVALGSRGAWLAWLVGVASLVILRGGSRWWASAAASVVAGGAALILWLEPTAAERVGEVGSEFRWELWRAALAVWRDLPWLGAGSGMFEPVFAWESGLVPSTGATFRHPDSSWVLLLFEHGVIGWLLLGAVVAWWGWSSSRRGSGEAAENERALRAGARAAVVAWVVAAGFDISFHRPALLALGVPLLALGWPARARGAARWPSVAFAMALLGVGAWAGRHQVTPIDAAPAYVGQGVHAELTPRAAQLLAAHPLEVRIHHRWGTDALNAGAPWIAARHWRAIVARQPAAEEGTLAYARALHGVAPTEALFFWRHYLAHAEERAPSRLERMLDEFGRTQINYWREAIAPRAELLVLLADEERPEAERCFADWQRLPMAQRVTVPMRYVAPVFVRWASTREFQEWVAAAPSWPWSEGVQEAQRCAQRGRPDLAWVLLTRMVPRPARVAAVERSVPAELIARVRPGDYARLASALADERLAAAERLTLLEAAAQRPDCPAWFRVELAYTLAETGRRALAVDRLLEVARTMRRAN